MHAGPEAKVEVLMQYRRLRHTGRKHQPSDDVSPIQRQWIFRLVAPDKDQELSQKNRLRESKEVVGQFPNTGDVEGFSEGCRYSSDQTWTVHKTDR